MASDSSQYGTPKAGVETRIANVHSVEFSYPQRTLFHNFSAAIPAGVTWVGGDENTGKTTLLRLLAGEVTPHAGEIDYGPIASRKPGAATAIYIDPKSEQFDKFSVTQFRVHMQERHPLFDAGAWKEMAYALGLGDHLQKSIYMLSTGSKRKLFLAAALCAGAPLTLLDEPFAALDLSSVRKVQVYLRAWSDSSDRACVVADYLPPTDVALVQSIVLPTRY
jgi:ABC-type multidrug transport system ATPase subunit